ncbi:MAG: hypothetical protein H2069_05550 [Legionella sp.]|nr:hypothetical protein [Legionella sp.]
MAKYTKIAEKLRSLDLSETAKQISQNKVNWHKTRVKIYNQWTNSLLSLKNKQNHYSSHTISSDAVITKTLEEKAQKKATSANNKLPKRPNSPHKNTVNNELQDQNEKSFSQGQLYENLTESLYTLRKANLDRYSKIEIIDGNPVRIFLPSKKITQSGEVNANVTLDVGDAFARGLDVARAVSEILRHDARRFEHQKTSFHAKYYTDLVTLLRGFQTRMAEIEQLEQRAQQSGNTKEAKNALKAAKLEVAEFSGALNALVSEALGLKKQKQSMEAINFVRDVLWKRDMVSASCTIEETGKRGEIGYGLTCRYFEPMKFSDHRENNQDVDNGRQGFDKSGELEPRHHPLKLQDRDAIWGSTEGSTYKTKPWFKELAKKIGVKEPNPKPGKTSSERVDREKHWFDSFMDENLQSMKGMSSTAMSRYTPNPANASIRTDILFNGENTALQLINHHILFSVAAPLGLKNGASLQAITNYNQAQIISRENLKTCFDTYFQNWQGIIDPVNTVHEIPIFYQTLIGDEVTFSPDQKKAKASLFSGSLIDHKAKATKALKEELKNVVILRHSQTGEVYFVPRKKGLPDSIPQGYAEIKLNLLETNNCINMWDFRARVRNNDYRDSRALIDHFAQLIKAKGKKLPGKLNVHTLSYEKHIKPILEFLQSDNYSYFSDHKKPSKEIEEILENLNRVAHKEMEETTLSSEETTLSSEVKKPNASDKPLDTVNKFDQSQRTKNNFILALNAAVQLKCLVHETVFGAMRRRVANFTRDYFRKVPVIGHIADWTIRGSMALLALVGKLAVGILTFPVSIPRAIKTIFHRKAISKACFEGILADAIGLRAGGCMSSADRATELMEQTAAYKKAFLNLSVANVWDSFKTKMNLLKEYGSTFAKHFYLKLMLGWDSDKPEETEGVFNPRGVLSKLRSNSDKLLSKVFSGFRKGNYKTMTVEEYKRRAAPLPQQEQANTSFSVVNHHQPKSSGLVETQKNPSHPHHAEKNKPIVHNPSSISACKLFDHKHREEYPISDPSKKQENQEESSGSSESSSRERSF